MAFLKQSGIADCPIEDLPLCTNYRPGLGRTIKVWKWDISIVIARRSRQGGRGE